MGKRYRVKFRVRATIEMNKIFDRRWLVPKTQRVVIPFSGFLNRHGKVPNIKLTTVYSFVYVWL